MGVIIKRIAVLTVVQENSSHNLQSRKIYRARPGRYIELVPVEKLAEKVRFEDSSIHQHLSAIEKIRNRINTFFSNVSTLILTANNSMHFFVVRSHV